MGYESNDYLNRDRDQGEEAEFRISLALDQLKEKQFIYGYIRAKKNGELDACGIDFLIKLFGGLALILQVKSSHSSVRRHHYKYPHIPCIVIEPRHKRIRSIERRIMALVRNKILMLRKRYAKFIK